MLMVAGVSGEEDGRNLVWGWFYFLFQRPLLVRAICYRLFLLNFNHEIFAKP